MNYNGKNKNCMKERIIEIIESKAQGKYHLEIDEPDLKVIANEILKLFDVSYSVFDNETIQRIRNSSSDAEVRRMIKTKIQKL